MQELNEEQQQAVESGDGPVLIVAGPGTGKTKTLTARIVHLLTKGNVAPEQIVALTFTKKAAQEIRSRVRQALVADGNGKKLPTITTFHGLCHELLDNNKPFLSDAQRLHIIKNIPKPAGLKGMSTRELGLIISRAKNTTQKSEDEVAKLVEAYNTALAKEGLRDFDDLLLEAHDLLKQDEAKRQAVAAQYRHILVDEFQDTNNLQYSLLTVLRSHDNLFVIGDPHQSIYGFRGSSGSVFEAFKADFPGYTAITLTTNYRSVPPIVNLANAMFPDAPPLTAASKLEGEVCAIEVLNEYGEARWIIDRIQTAIGGGDMLKGVSNDRRTAHRRLSDFAVLYRSRPAALTFQKVLEESGLPYQVVGDGSPYDKPQVQAIIALLRASATGRDVAIEGYSSAQQHLLTELLHQRTERLPTVLVEKIMAILGFEPTRDLQQFLGTLVRFKDLSEALAYIDSMGEYGFYDPQADAITLMTIHASKGLEFPYVFLLAAEEGILPSLRQADMAEERRLFYVAVTRAREQLEVLHAKNRGAKPAEASRFIRELPPSVLPCRIDPGIAKQVQHIIKRAAKRNQQSLF